MSEGELLDLVCGPASPLPETYQRYRLVAHLGSGGQAEVYRAVRLCGGVTSAPMTVKVFRIDPQRPLVNELRSWDKGDAALMDLNNRGVTGICRRADGFYGPPPHRPGERPDAGEAVPYQVYDYLHGINLRQYVSQRAGLEPGARRLNALSALRTLAGVLRALHLPQDTGATPVLHMDIKPANLMVLTNGDVRLIDFTGARYWRIEEITQVAYTPESGGPEAFGGARSVGPAYDVHGFGAVAYYLVTGAYPRVDASGSTPLGPDSVLRRHPMLERMPTLRDHLHAPLADRPGERPDTRDLDGWLAQLGELVRRGGIADVGVDWTEPDRGEPGRGESLRVVGRATARPPVTGTETDAFQRIEQLERELVALRADATMRPAIAARIAPTAVGNPAMAGSPTMVGNPAMAGSPTMVGNPAMAGSHTMVGGPGRPEMPVYAGPPPYAGPSQSGAAAPQMGGLGPSSGAPAPGSAGSGRMLGRAKVPPPKPSQRSEIMDDLPQEPADQWSQRPRPSMRSLKQGWELTGASAVFAFVCWGIWAASSGGRLTTPVLAFIVVLAVAAGLFTLVRLLGRIVIEQRLGRARHGARGAHAVTGLFLAVAGLAYLRQTSWIVSAFTWIKEILQ